MSKVVQLKRKPRPLKKRYQPTSPYVVQREDQEGGAIAYNIFDERPDSYRFVCSISDDYNRYAKHDAEQVVRGLNLLVQCGKETLPSVKE